MTLLLLQRNQPGCPGRWRTVHRFDEGEALTVLEAAARMAKVGEPMRWRVVKDDRWQEPVLEWSRDSGWRDL